MERALYNNQKPSVQMGNYCFLIAGVEMLLSCRTFVRFIFEYAKNPPPSDTVNLCPICLAMIRYMDKENLLSLYREIEKIVFDSLNIKDFGQMEDMNVIFLHFQKSKVYCGFFAPFVYVLNLKCKLPLTDKRGIYMIRQFSPVPLVKACNKEGVFSFAIRAGNHYEIYQRYKKENSNMIFVAKNTNYLLNSRWDILCVMCIDINPVLHDLLNTT